MAIRTCQCEYAKLSWVQDGDFSNDGLFVTGLCSPGPSLDRSSKVKTKGVSFGHPLLNSSLHNFDPPRPPCRRSLSNHYHRHLRQTRLPVSSSFGILAFLASFSTRVAAFSPTTAHFLEQRQASCLKARLRWEIQVIDY